MTTDRISLSFFVICCFGVFVKTLFYLCYVMCVYHYCCYYYYYYYLNMIVDLEIVKRQHYIEMLKIQSDEMIAARLSYSLYMAFAIVVGALLKT